MIEPKKRQGFTFNDAEVAAMSQLFNVLYRGGDTRVLLRSPALLAVARRFKDRAARSAAASSVPQTGT